MNDNRKALFAIALVALVALAFGIFGHRPTKCEGLASKRDRDSAVLGTLQPGTEQFRYAAAKQAALYDEMQREGCPLQ